MESRSPFDAESQLIGRYLPRSNRDDLAIEQQRPNPLCIGGKPIYQISRQPAKRADREVQAVRRQYRYDSATARPAQLA